MIALQKNLAAGAIASMAAVVMSVAPVNAQPNPKPTPAVRFHFDVSQAHLSSHNGTIYGGGWETGIRAGVSWNHLDNTLTYRNLSTSFDMPNTYWNESYWEDDLDYCYEDDFWDGQVAYIEAGASYEHLNIIDSGFRYSADGVGFNTGFSLHSTPRLSEYGRITYVPVLTPGSGLNQQFSRQQYDFGVRYKPSASNGFFFEGGYFEDVLQGKSGNGGIYNYGPYLGVGSRF